MELFFQHVDDKIRMYGKVFAREDTDGVKQDTYDQGMHLRPYEKLIVWQEAHKLCLFIYDVTKGFPPEERFRLVDQMCSSASSVPTNIAEGNMRRTLRDKRHFLDIAQASLEELHYQCVLARDLHYLSKEQFEDADDRIQRVSFLLTRLHASLC